MKKKLRSLTVLLLCLSMAIPLSVEAASGKDAPLFSDEYRSYYLKENQIKTESFKKENKILDKVVKKLQEQEPVAVEERSKIGKLSYWARTNEQTDYYYVGGMKDNQPDGIGILYKRISSASLGLSRDFSDMYYVRLYEGDFEEGRKEGFGREYYSTLDSLKVSESETDICPIDLYEEISSDIQTNIYETANPLCYEGYFKKNKYSGEGNLYEYPVVDKVQYYSDQRADIEKQINDVLNSYGSDSADESQESDYIIADSDKRLLTESDLQGLSNLKISLAVNEIYARHGRLFKDQSIQDYFNGCSWYSGYILPEEFDDSVFSDIEKKNVEFLAKYRDSGADFEGENTNQNETDHTASNDITDYSTKHIIVYTGEFKKGKENGKLKVYYDGYLLYEGISKKGEIDGKGTLYYQGTKNIRYKGELKNGQYNGKGTSYDQNGNIEYKGQWENGNYAD